MTLPGLSRVFNFTPIYKKALKIGLFFDTIPFPAKIKRATKHGLRGESK